MKKLHILTLFLLVVFSIQVFAAPPFIESTEFTADKNLVIESNIASHYKLNEGACAYLHVFNKSSGGRMNNETQKVSCQVHLYNNNGSIIMEGTPTFEEDYWKICRPPSVLQIGGDYHLVVHCNSSEVGGYKVYRFRAYNDGFNFDVDPDIEIIQGAMFPTIMSFIIIIIFSSVIGLINSGDGGLKFAIRFMGFGLASIEILAMTYYIYLIQFNGNVLLLLRTNFWVMFILGFGLGMLSFINLTKKMVDPTDEDTGDISGNDRKLNDFDGV